MCLYFQYKFIPLQFHDCKKETLQGVFEAAKQTVSDSNEFVNPWWAQYRCYCCCFSVCESLSELIDPDFVSA